MDAASLERIARTPVSAARLATVRRTIPAIGRLRQPVLEAAVTQLWAAVWKHSGAEQLRHLPYGPGNLAAANLIDHVNEVNELAARLISHGRSHHGLEPVTATVMAAAILHDIDKPLLWGPMDDGSIDLFPGRSNTDHGALGYELLRSVDVPVDIADIVRGHSPYSPLLECRRSPEAVVVHLADIASVNLTHLQLGMRPPCGSGVLERPSDYPEDRVNV